MSDDGPIKVYLGNYDLASTDILIPAEVLARANAELDAERQRRREVAKPTPEPVRKFWLQRLCAWMRSRRS
jgi:hypothetical protein